MGFTKTKTIETPTIGRELRNLRTEQGVGIETLAETTKIQSRYLRALEKGGLHTLPAPVYVRGMLRRIACVLRHDPKELIALYERDRRIDAHMNGIPLGDRPLGLHHNRSFAVTPRTMTLALATLVVLAFIGYTAIQIGGLLTPPDLSIVTPEENVVLLANAVTIAGETESGAVVTINGEDIYVGPRGDFEVEFPLQEGMNRFRIQSENRFGKISEAVRQIVVPVEGGEGSP